MPAKFPESFPTQILYLFISASLLDEEEPRISQDSGRQLAHIMNGDVHSIHALHENPGNLCFPSVFGNRMFCSDSSEVPSYQALVNLFMFLGTLWFSSVVALVLLEKQTIHSTRRG